MELMQWIRTSLLLAQSCWIVLSSEDKSSVQCACTTEACHKEQKITCTGRHFCYVQYLPVLREESSSEEFIERGCIDESTPLLCENRRPANISPDTPWPVLLCCNDRDFCNQDVIPSIPESEKAVLQNRTWSLVPDKTSDDHNHFNKQHPPVIYSPQDHTYVHKQLKSNISQTTPPQNKHQRSKRVKSINPLYIAVPLAGLCVLLALVIFALYLLRRRNYYFGNEIPTHHQIGLGFDTEDVRGTDIRSVQTGQRGGHTRPCIVRANRCTDCERSSLGSETKLFNQT